MKASEYQRLYGPCIGNQNVKKDKPQIRLPKMRRPNKTEAEFGEILSKSYYGAKILYEAITFRLPSGTRYTPDWTVWNESRLALVVEIKGAHIHSAASIRAFKEARAAFPNLLFRFAQKLKSGWTTTE